MYALLYEKKIIALSDTKSILEDAVVVKVTSLDELRGYIPHDSQTPLVNLGLVELDRKDQEKEKLEIDCGGLETRIAELRAEISKISGPVVDMIKEKGKEIFEKLNKENKDKTDPPKPKDPVAELGKMFSKIGDYLRNDC
jgi:hypothetical protein